MINKFTKNLKNLPMSPPNSTSWRHTQQVDPATALATGCSWYGGPRRWSLSLSSEMTTSLRAAARAPSAGCASGATGRGGSARGATGSSGRPRPARGSKSNGSPAGSGTAFLELQILIKNIYKFKLKSAKICKTVLELYEFWCLRSIGDEDGSGKNVQDRSEVKSARRSRSFAVQGNAYVPVMPRRAI